MARAYVLLCVRVLLFVYLCLSVRVRVRLRVCERTHSARTRAHAHALGAWRPKCFDATNSVPRNSTGELTPFSKFRDRRDKLDEHQTQIELWTGICGEGPRVHARIRLHDCSQT